MFFSLSLFICLLFILLVVPSRSEAIEIDVNGGMCLAIIVKDGLMNNCFDTAQKLELSDVARYEELLINIYDNGTGELRNSALAKNSAIKNDETSSKFQILWPTDTTVVTNNLVSFHVQFEDSFGGCFLKKAVEGGSDNDLSLPKPYSFLCVVTGDGWMQCYERPCTDAPSLTHATNDHSNDDYQEFVQESNMMASLYLPNRQYEVHLVVLQQQSPLAAGDGPNGLGRYITAEDAGLLPLSRVLLEDNTTFSAIDPLMRQGLEATGMGHRALDVHKSARLVDMLRDRGILQRSREFTVASYTNGSIYENACEGGVEGVAEVGEESVCCSQQAPSLLPLETDPLIGEARFGASIVVPPAAGIDLTAAMHLLFMSARSIDRYQEGEIFLKSVLHSRYQLNAANNNSESSNDGTKINRPLVLHLVLDEAGKQYFGELIWGVYEGVHSHPSSTSTSTGNGRHSDDSGVLNGHRLQNLGVIIAFHDFSDVCEAPLTQFLADVRMTMSPHHSGAAGYCRLFMADYFHSLNNQADFEESNSSSNGAPLTSIHREVFTHIRHLLSLETDQLVFADVEHLWNESIELLNSNGSGEGCSNVGSRMLCEDVAVVAAAENYQPWQDSRPDGVGGGAEEYSELLRGNDYHGYGLIGGVMMLHIKQMQQMQWLQTRVIPVIRKHANPPRFHTHRNYSASTSTRGSSIRWKALLNDQDIFNTIFGIFPGQWRVLNCSWNVQFHARLNSLISCYHARTTQLSNTSSTPSVVNSTIERESGEMNDAAVDSAIPTHQLKHRPFHHSPHTRMSLTPETCDNLTQRRMFVCPYQAKVLHFMAQVHYVTRHIPYFIPSHLHVCVVTVTDIPALWRLCTALLFYVISLFCSVVLVIYAECSILGLLRRCMALLPSTFVGTSDMNQLLIGAAAGA